MKKWLILALFFALTIGWIWLAIDRNDEAYGIFPRTPPTPDFGLVNICEKIANVYATPENIDKGILSSRCYIALIEEKYWEEDTASILSESFGFRVDPSIIVLAMGSS